MYKVLRVDKDAYITDRVIKTVRAYTSNVGDAGSLDLFKLYGITSSGSNPNVELSRLLVHFDLQPLRDLVTAGRLDPGHPSFNCTLKLFDVYGGQPTPRNFTVAVHPLSRSFDEGLGRDVVYYADHDVCNFLTGSRAQGPWLLSGCAEGGGLPGTVDYVTASTNVAGGASLKSSQLFATGEEDLEVDVTLAVSATLAGLLPDEGFRIAYDATHENDNRTYFVKRFASHTAYNEAKHPRLIVKYDDSIQDDTLDLNLDSPSTLFLYNYARHAPANLTSGSALTPITGPDCLILKLVTEVSGGTYALIFTGSQHRSGINFVKGVYSASFTLPSTDPVFNAKLAQSSSIKLTPVWGSLDGTVTYVTGSAIRAYPALRGGASLDPQRFVVSLIGLRDTHLRTEDTVLRIHIFDHTSPMVIVGKVPVEMPGIVVRDVHYQVRDLSTNEVEIPFDTVKNSTRASSDAQGMYFRLDMSNLTPDRLYVIDVLIETGNNQQVYQAASPAFRVS
jgi:hypothetical protein